VVSKHIVLYDVASGKELRRLQAFKDDPESFAFSPDGKTLICTEDRKTLALWDVATGRKQRGIDAEAWRVAFAPDGRSVASGSKHTLEITELATGRVRLRLPTPLSGELHRLTDSIRFSRNGRRVAVFRPNDIFVFSLDRRAEILHVRYPDNQYLNTVVGALSPDGRWLVHTASIHDPTLYLRDLDSPRAAAESIALTGHQMGVNDVQFSPDGKVFMSASEDGTALVWDIKLLTENPRPVRVDTAAVEAHLVTLSDADAEKAGRAMAVLEKFPEVTVPLLRSHLGPVKAPGPAHVERLVTDLDSADFATRNRATRALEQLAEQAEPALRKALTRKLNLEAERRILALLNRLEGPLTDRSALRAVRAVEVLERIGTAESRKLLEHLASGDPAARLTREARASLDRLTQK
jgi:hypothetical protein